ncbi:PIN domain-containing protein [Endozoicomonas sp.]|uniref:type II toxin-antitoxin system VapC family toxin n=1 Tax=Endozoicomonas sp. TaxID=1892382 RepID=UPI0028836B65|nr:PIN domain-containing protein [Endozoicomonas sp.]
MVLVDTCVWSAALRRKAPNLPLAAETLLLQRLIRQHRAVMIGPILQKVLTGIRHEQQFINLKAKLSAFDLLSISTVDYISAAGLSNTCQRKGIQGSHTDFLIAAVAIQQQIPILTTDKDFTHYQKYIPLMLYANPKSFQS